MQDPTFAARAADKPEAIDLSHHLSLLARSRQTSPLKGMYKYFNKPGMLMFAGGLPSPAVFPFESISAQTLVPNSFKTSQSSWNWLFSLFGAGEGAVKTTRIDIPKYVENPTPTSLQLSTALQYGTAAGLPALGAFINDFTARVFDPGYSGWATTLNAGSTDAWSKICTMLCERGAGILCEEWTYPSALAAAWPSGFSPVPLPMDGGGMTPEGLEDLLGNWDILARGGMARPTVLYTIPVCQNPTGATMTVERKQAIYDICVKYDVIIVEDDPYYFLQAGEYEPPSSRVRATRTESDDEFLASLVPSYLKFDTQGRVIRIDTFSKTICPGSRLGWTTANPLFIERLQRANESSTQAASGFAQVLVAKLLCEEWKMTGYMRWLKGLKAQYRDRRDTLVDALLDQAHAGLDARAAASNRAGVAQVFEFHKKDARARDEKGFLQETDEKREHRDSKAILSFVAPQGGMFVWLRVHFASHPSYPLHSTSSLIQALWESLAEHNLLVAPGTMFSAKRFGQPLGGEDVAAFEAEEQYMTDDEGDGWFRIAFSTATAKEMQEAGKIIGKQVKEFWDGEGM